MLNIPATNLEVGQHLQGVDHCGNGVARGLDEATKFGYERCEFMPRGHSKFFFHRNDAVCN
jgi:hypothetical protein